MKKLVAILLLCFGMFATAQAQESTGDPAAGKTKTQQVIASIPALQSIAQEIEAFEAKTEGKKEQFENANADLKALKMKYAAELETQIAVNKENPEIVSVLTEELRKTREEIARL